VAECYEPGNGVENGDGEASEDGHSGSKMKSGSEVEFGSVKNRRRKRRWKASADLITDLKYNN
jgi:hypothetical protein